MTRRNLIFACMGPGPGTVDFAPETDADGADRRTWDLVEVLWHPDMIRAHRAEARVTNADLVIVEGDRSLRKFACWAKFARLFPDLAARYDAVLVADDDLAPWRCSWSDVFSLFHASGLSVAQPALTRDSTRVWSWPVTHQDPDAACLWRTTDFVEVMMPVFTREAIREALPFFADEPYGLGLETWWHLAFAHRGRGGLGVLDAAPVRHVRPLGSAHSMTGLAGLGGKHPFEIAREFRARHRLPEAFRDDTCWTLARWGRDETGRHVQLPPHPAGGGEALGLDIQVVEAVTKTLRSSLHPNSSLPAGEARPARGLSDLSSSLERP